jgi:HSP20 family protein
MTSITRYTTSPEFRTLQSQMNRLFEPFLGRAFDDQDLASGSWVPPVDVVEEKDAILVSAELPGLRAEDVEIQYENGVLVLRGQRTFQQESSERTYHRVERAYGTFVRSFTLPRSADPDKITASFQNGLLEVRVPKREEAKPKMIPINSK